MKFLLMSQGVENESIKQALLELLGKPFSEAVMTFIPTASFASPGDKTWLLNMMSQFHGLGFKKFNMVDIGSTPEDYWLPVLEDSDFLMFSGGNSRHLAHTMERIDFKKHLDRLLETRVYGGNSAGSMVTCSGLEMSGNTHSSYTSLYDPDAAPALGYHNFHIRPHWGHPSHTTSTEEWVENTINEKNITEPVYLIDDQSALKVVDGGVEVISEGNVKIYNQ